MKKTWLYLFAALLISCTADKVKRQDIVVVNDQKMSVQSFAKELTNVLQGKDIVVIKNTAAFQAAKNKVLLDFIQHAIVNDYAQKNQIQLTPSEVKLEIEGYRSNYPDDISFRAALAEEGIAYADWEEKVKKSLLEKKVFMKVSSTYEEPSSSELKAYYDANRKKFYKNEAHKIKQIVLSKSIDAENLYNLLKKRGSFEKLAKEFSIGAEANNGGLLGWVDKGVSDIFDAAAKLPLRQVSKPVKSDFGYHIIMVDAKRPARYQPFSEVEEQIKQEFIEERRQKIYDAWFEEQKKQAKVALNEELLRSISIDLKQ